jgi:hypothetical protein
MRRLFAALALALALAPFGFAAGADTLTSRIHGCISGRLLGTNDLGTVASEFPVCDPDALANGTASDQADLIFADQRTIAASSTENLDLAGVLVSPHGATLTLATVKAIYVLAAAANTNNVVIGGAASNTFTGPFADATDKIAVRPGGIWVISAPETGWTVTAGTGDILLVANSGAGSGVTYDIIIVGTSS